MSSSTAFIPEGGWYEDMSLAKWLIKLAPVRKEIYEASYFDATMNIPDEMEICKRMESESKQ